ncbi:MAG: 2-phosphosulfolactate phosphatase [Candidatus Kapaibacterium sp.]
MSKPTVAGSIRNARAIAEFANNFSSVAVIPCGERWHDGTLRPAFEDFLGAGAIISSLNGIKSPEALAAQAIFESVESQIQNEIMRCASGIELIEQGFIDDVIIASSLNVSSTIPQIMNGEFRKLQVE